MTIRKVLENAIKTHIQVNNRLVTSPPKLLNLQIEGLRTWLNKQQSTWEENEMHNETGVIKDFINQLE